MRSSFMAAKEQRPEADMLDEIAAAQALDGLMEPQDMVYMYASGWPCG